MKITDQTIPPELADQFRRVVTPKKKAGVTTSATARKGTKLVRKTKKKMRTPLNDFTAPAAYIAQKLYPDRSPIENLPTTRRIIRELQSGYFDPAFWVLCEQEAATFITSNPDSILDPNPPPYNYRDESNQPSIPQYLDGYVGGSGMQYRGQLVGNQFKDQSLTWCRYNFRLPNTVADTGALFAIAVIQGSMSVTASHRGSKPMLSMISNAALTSDDDAALTTLSPPTVGIPVSAPSGVHASQSHYYRYKLPKTSPPYFSTFQLRPVIRNVPAFVTSGTGSNLSRIVMCLAPRPMFGRGFNNNTLVNTSLTANVWIYAIADKFMANLSKQSITQFWDAPRIFYDYKGDNCVVSTITPVKTDLVPGQTFEWNEYEFTVYSGYTWSTITIVQVGGHVFVVNNSQGFFLFAGLGNPWEGRKGSTITSNITFNESDESIEYNYAVTDIVRSFFWPNPQSDHFHVKIDKHGAVTRTLIGTYNVPAGPQGENFNHMTFTLD